MTIDEGYIKYNSNWNCQKILVPEKTLQEINDVRNKLVKMNMIGKIPNGPGFGNISIRVDADAFFISATDTGHLSQLTESDISEVYKTDVEKNTVWCKGEKNASSESMTHSVIYNVDVNSKAVIHIHHKAMWNHFLDHLPSTNSKISYGTPEMAIAISKLIENNSTHQLLVLGGHEDGLISYGSTLDEALSIIDNAFNLL